MDLLLVGAINVSILSWLFKARLDVMDRNKTYVVYCKVGARSKAAMKIIELLGFLDLTVLLIIEKNANY
jgi:phage shock protein E